MSNKRDSRVGEMTVPAESLDMPELDSKIRAVIGRALQSHYDDLISAPVPDRFLVLLAELEAQELRHE
jgi:hypothetical protein